MIEGTITVTLLERAQPGTIAARLAQIGEIPTIAQFAIEVVAAATDPHAPGHKVYVGGADYLSSCSSESPGLEPLGRRTGSKYRPSTSAPLRACPVDRSGGRWWTSLVLDRHDLTDAELARVGIGMPGAATARPAEVGSGDVRAAGDGR
jgi:hypothetical protein